MISSLFSGMCCDVCGAFLCMHVVLMLGNVLLQHCGFNFASLCDVTLIPVHVNCVDLAECRNRMRAVIWQLCGRFEASCGRCLLEIGAR